MFRKRRFQMIDDTHPDDYDFTKYFTGMHLRRLIEEQGFHRTKQLINRLTKRNASRVLRRYADFFPPDILMLTKEALFERYQQSVLEQMAA